jgi:urea transport system substrate-binding protein
VADVVALGADGKKVGVISTINGDANIGFYKELAAAGVSADDIPVVAFSVGEEELGSGHHPTLSVIWQPGTTSSPPMLDINAEFMPSGKPSPAKSGSPMTRWKPT